MPIYEYQDQSGQTLFKVRIDLRSNRDRNTRAVRKQSGIKSYREAVQTEKKLLKDAHNKLFEKEVKGDTWLNLIEAWYSFNVSNTVKLGARSITTVTDYRDGVLKWTRELKFELASNLTSYDFIEVFAKMHIAKTSFDFQRKMKRVMIEIFEFGISQGLIQDMRRLPVNEVQLKKTEPKPPEILTITEIEKFLEVAFGDHHPWRHVWAMALLTGMRNGELYALSWDDIDFDNRIITVSKSYNARLKIIKSTKAGYWRSVPISDDLLRILKELRTPGTDAEFVLPRLQNWKRGMQAQILRAFCESNGLKSIKFHTLRACFATQLIRQGVEPAKVMKVAGWKDLKTMQHYIRLAGIEIKGVTDSLKFLPAKDVIGNVVRLSR